MPTDLDFGPFLALPEDARRAVAARARAVRIARSERLFRAGDEPDAAYAVLAGRVRVIGEDGAVLATSAPALVGEIAVLEGRRRSAEVIALEPVRAVRIAAPALLEVAASHDGFARTLEAFAEARRASTFLHRQGPFVLGASLGRARPARGQAAALPGHGRGGADAPGRARRRRPAHPQRRGRSRTRGRRRRARAVAARAGGARRRDRRAHRLAPHRDRPRPLGRGRPRRGRRRRTRRRQASSRAPRPSHRGRRGTRPRGRDSTECARRRTTPRR